MSMANGSPFTWFERTQGTAQAAPFQAWVGVDSDDTERDLEHLVQPERRHRCHGHQPLRLPRADESGGGIPGRVCDLRRPGRLVRTARDVRSHVAAAQHCSRQGRGRGAATQRRPQRPGRADRGAAGPGAVCVAAHRRHQAPVSAGRRLEDQRHRGRAIPPARLRHGEQRAALADGGDDRGLQERRRGGHCHAARLPPPPGDDDRRRQGQHSPGERRREVHVEVGEWRTAGLRRQQLRARTDRQRRAAVHAGRGI